MTSTSLDLLLRAAGGDPELRETHGSWVALTPDRAYKLKKPVRFGFVDLTTPERRRWACEEEVRVNAALAADVVLGVRALLPGGELGPPDAPGAVDWVIEMRRYDEERTMASLLRRGALAHEDVERVARRIAEFHAGAPVERRDDHAAVVAAMFDDNAAELLDVVGGADAAALPEVGGDESTAELLDRRVRRPAAAVRRFAAAFTAARREVLDARGREGRVRECHGDLRLDHVLLLDDRVTIVDRLEFDVNLRTLDVADDLAFLAMDLEANGARDAAEALVAAYRAAGGDAGDDALVAFFSSHRALVRSKVDLLRAGQLGSGAPESADLVRRAAARAGLAERLAWRARGPVVLLVHGPPASGKSVLAAALARRGGLATIATDAVRKELLGLASGERADADAYTVEGRRAVYEEVGRRCRAALERGEGVVVDATFGDPDARGAFFTALGPRRDDLLAVRCTAPPDVLVARAAERARGPSLSDAGPEEARRLAASFVDLDEVPGSRRLELSTDRDPDDLADAVADWLDSARRGG